MMKDFNFFSEYVYVKSNFRMSNLILPLIYLVMFLVMGFFFYTMEKDENDLQTVSDENKAFIESAEYRNMIEKNGKLTGELEIMVATGLELEIFESLIPYSYRVTEELLLDILHSIPRNVAFISYDISSLGISASVVSSGYPYIAELEKNLRELDYVEDVFIDGISTDAVDIESDQAELAYEAGYYSFKITIVFGGMEND